MITGYNNDIKHRGTVFHVQTEDKGEASAWIESLIYTGGRILARKRATYKQLLEEGADRAAIAKLMERQHRLMIRQIREGRFDEETSDGVPTGVPPPEDDPDIHTARMQQQAEAMFAPPGSTGTPPSEILEQEAAAARAEVDAEREEERREEEAAASPVVAASEAAGQAAAGSAQGAGAEAAPESGAPPSPPPAPPASAEASTPQTATETPEQQGPSDEEGPPEEPGPPEESAPPAPVEDDDDIEVELGPAPTLDQVIFDYLSSVAQEESLVLLMDESPALASGTTTRMDLGTHASRSGKPIAEAAIAVRMISKTGGPVTLAEGVTDAEGTLQLVVDVPEVDRDSAALIITAASSIGNAEIKHLL